MREPGFWWHQAGAGAALLSPFAAAYGAVAARRLRRSGTRAAVPVICVGNLTVGGAGKTPAALAIAVMLAEAGERPVALSRGYRGTLMGPVVVDIAAHRATDVGDEALLLARAVPTVVAHDRVAGANLAVKEGASVILMDDGFQNPSLEKDLSLIVIDGRRAVGNGRVIPAGPLRAPLHDQLAHAHALIIVGSKSAASKAVVTAAGNLAVFNARLVPDPEAIAALRDASVSAFAGIGDPKKFFATLREAGVHVAATRGFADHHRYREPEADQLCAQAERNGWTLVTTEKDFARLGGDERLARLAGQSRVLPVTLAFDQVEEFKEFLRARLTNVRATRD